MKRTHSRPFHITKWTMFLSFFLPVAESFSQIDLSRYMDGNALPLISLNDHIKVNFKWDMKGNVQADLNDGLNNLDEDKPRLAIANFDEVIKLDPKLWVSYYYRGICNKKLNQLDASEKDFLTAISLNPNQAEIHLELGETYHLDKKPAKASREYQKTIDINPLLVQGYYSLGSLSLMNGDLKKGIKYYEKCNSINPHFPEAYMMEGVLKLQVEKEDSTSILFFNQAVKADSMYSQTYFWRGLAYLRTNQPDKCLTDWNKLVRYNPENSFYILMRGFLYIELNQFDEAFADLRKALKGRAINEDKFNAQQTLLDKQIDLQFAANYLISKGYGLKEESFNYLKKGFCLLLAGRNKEAYENLDRAEKLQRSSAVFFIKAITFEHSDQHQGAYVYYDNALQLDNDIFDAHKKRSVYRFEAKDWKGAYNDIDEMFRIQPGSPIAFRLRGLIKSNEKDYVGAIEDLTKFLKTDSTDMEALRTRGLCEQFTEDLKSANEDYRRILAIYPLEGAMYEQLSKNCLVLKDTAGAIAAFQLYIEKKPDEMTPYFEIAKIYIDSKKWNNAWDEMDKAKKMLGYRADFNPNLVSKIFCVEGKIEFQQLAYGKAISKFNKALEKDRTNLDALYFRARSYQLSGDLKKSINDYARLKEFHYLDAEQCYNSLLQK